MSGKNEKKSGDSLSGHMSFANILGTYAALAGTLFGLFFTRSQLRIAESEEARARRAEPLAYTLEAVDTHYQYEIQWDGGAASIPAPAYRLRVSHGSLRSVTAISFDGREFHELRTLPMEDEWEGGPLDIAMPAQYVVEDGVAYDYFFLFLEPVEGPSQLDLVCTEISLDTWETGSSVQRCIDLARRDFLPPGAQRDMLETYSVLRDTLKSLELLPA